MEILLCDLQLWGRCLGDRTLLLIYSCSPCPSPWSLLQYLQIEQKEAEERLPTAVQKIPRTWSREKQIQLISRRVRAQTLPYSKLSARCGNAMCSGTGHSQQDCRQGTAVWLNKRLCYACGFKAAPKDEGEHPARACHTPVSERQQHITSHLKCAAQSTVTRSQHLYFTSGT